MRKQTWTSITDEARDVLGKKFDVLARLKEMAVEVLGGRVRCVRVLHYDRAARTDYLWERSGAGS